MSRTGAKLPPLPNSASYIAPTPVPEDADALFANLLRQAADGRRGV